MLKNNPVVRVWSNWRSGDRQTLDLALKAEAMVRELNQIPPYGGDDAPEMAEILNSICQLLDRQLKQKEQPIAQPVLSVSETVEPQPPASKEPEPTLSQTAKELIKLRDWVFLACHGEATGDRPKFESLYQKLGKILSLEGVSVLEETGVFNYAQQQVIDTVPTADPAQDETIASTVRPGYQFNQKLVRPQEVIVFTYQAMDSLNNESKDSKNSDFNPPNSP
jgi:hypothetical protein